MAVVAPEGGGKGDIAIAIDLFLVRRSEAKDEEGGSRSSREYNDSRNDNGNNDGGGLGQTFFTGLFDRSLLK
jgi:hypothetical protein